MQNAEAEVECCLCLCCRQTGAGRHGSRQLDAALAVAEQIKRPILRMPNKEEVAALDRLILEVASPRTKRLLQDYKLQSKVRCMLVASLCTYHKKVARGCRACYLANNKV